MSNDDDNNGASVDLKPVVYNLPSTPSKNIK